MAIGSPPTGIDMAPVSHYNDVIMSTVASQITSLKIVYSAVNSGVDQINITAPRHWLLCAGNSPVICEFPAQRASNTEMFPFDDAIMHDTDYAG